jgi:cytochrome P450
MEVSASVGHASDLAHPSTYESGYPFALWDQMRREAPVCWVEADGYPPFWAITRHADVTAVSRDPDRFRSAGRWLMLPESVDIDGSRTGAPPLRMLVNMDPPEHRDYRRLASGWFTPRNLTRVEDRVRDRVRSLLDALRHRENSDLVTDLAAWLPLGVIMEMLGLPEADEDLVLRLSNENFGVADPDFRRPDDQRDGFLHDLGTYLLNIAKEKRRRPANDLTSVLATARLGDEALPDFELMSYLYLVATAGHETTRNAIAGGLLAFAEEPDQYDALRAEPSLVASAVEEILRWTSPIVHFARTATADVPLGDQQVRAGESVVLFYPAANRDHSVFESPHEFRIDRDPNPHVAFGLGEHFCLGAALARMELRVLLEEVAPIVRGVELHGQPRRLRSNFVGGLKALPARLAFG